MKRPSSALQSGDLYYRNNVLAAVREVVARFEDRKGNAIADHVLQQLIEAYDPANSNLFGNKSELAAKLSEWSGRSVTRDMVRFWLHPDPKRRRQPSLAYGLLLIAAAPQFITKKQNTQ